VSLIDQLRRNVEPGPFYEDASEPFQFDSWPVRLIAYYLPQFHATPENDRWWGKGFTEWTNVTKSFPRFPGHYQPHLPGELGFYDLRSPEVLYRQAALARTYGLCGFCIHHYWFSGKTVLDEPLKILLRNRDIDISFCLNWANENWTRRWDGKDQEVLLAQQYSPADDLALARSLEPALADPRYLRIEGRPLLMIYRPGILPDPRATAERWRNHFERAGYGNPYLVMAQVFDDMDPREFGMDAAAGFPPHNCGLSHPRYRRLIRRLRHPRFTGTTFTYDDMMHGALDNQPDEFSLLPGVCPGWDNHPRRQRGAVAICGSTPQKYGAWLRATCDYTLATHPPAERLVFINAWNEWGEGAHLEPDRHFGYAYLAETARVMSAIVEHSTQNESAPLSRNCA
jgi:lipopolysaccharide biosynthesis protein